MKGIVFCVLVLLPASALGCTTVIVGKDATIDGSVRSHRQGLRFLFYVKKHFSENNTFCASFRLSHISRTSPFLPSFHVSFQGDGNTQRWWGCRPRLEAVAYAGTFVSLSLSWAHYLAPAIPSLTVLFDYVSMTLCLGSRPLTWKYGRAMLFLFGTMELPT